MTRQRPERVVVIRPVDQLELSGPQTKLPAPQKHLPLVSLRCWRVNGPARTVADIVTLQGSGNALGSAHHGGNRCARHCQCCERLRTTVSAPRRGMDAEYQRMPGSSAWLDHRALFFLYQNIPQRQIIIDNNLCADVNSVRIVASSFQSRPDTAHTVS